MRLVYIAAAFTVVIVWGLNIVVGKLGVVALPPLLFITLRATCVAVLLVPFLGKLPERKALFGSIILIFGVLQFIGLFVGLSGVDGAVAAIALQTLVPFGMILGRIKFGERMNLLQILGVMAAFGGVVVIAGEPKVASRMSHLMMVIGAAFCMAYGSVLIKDLGPMNIFRLQGWLALGSAPLLFLASLAFEHHQLDALARAGWAGWGGILYTGIATTIIGHGLWAYLLQHLPVYRVMPISLLAAVAAVAFSIALLGEPLTLNVLIGGMLTLSGVAVIQTATVRRK